MSRLPSRLICLDRQPMFNIARRGPSSIARSSSSFPAFSRYNSLANARQVQPCLPCTVSPRTAKSPRSNAAWSRSAASRATAAVAEDEAVEEQIEQGVSSQAPPSYEHLDQTVRGGSVTKFAELAERGMVCQTVVDTITKGLGLETMTEVQSMTIEKSLKGQDIIAQARTGTGKTLAFLIPLLQNIIRADPLLETRSRMGRRGGDGTDIRAIIISPTRELAEQIAVEAKKLTAGTGVIVQTAVGGSAKGAGLRKIRFEGCNVLVGTPGRLNDILSDQYTQVRAPNLSCLVLDEADRLLDNGFEFEIKSIQDSLPKRSEVDRQTLLYSATVPREIMEIVRATMKPDFQFIRTVREGEQPTHQKVPQKIVSVAGMENFMPVLLELCKRGMGPAAEPTEEPVRPFKAIVYFSSTADVSLAAAILNNLRNPGQSIFHQGPLHPAKIIEMHARLDQEARTRAADSFRRASSGIMLSSDVTARGMDFPNVTHVIQIGLPPSEEQYIHRLGRTARGDKTGEGWIVLSNFELPVVRYRLRKMPLQPDNTLETAKVDMKKDAQLPEHVAKILTQIGDAVKMVPRRLKSASYMASLGMYSYVEDKRALINAMNDRAKYGWGMMEPPMVSRSLASRLRLTQVPGLNIGSEERAYGELESVKAEEERARLRPYRDYRDNLNKPPWQRRGRIGRGSPNAIAGARRAGFEDFPENRKDSFNGGFDRRYGADSGARSKRPGHRY